MAPLPNLPFQKAGEVLEGYDLSEERKNMLYVCTFSPARLRDGHHLECIEEALRVFQEDCYAVCAVEDDDERPIAFHLLIKDEPATKAEMQRLIDVIRDQGLLQPKRYARAIAPVLHASWQDMPLSERILLLQTAGEPAELATEDNPSQATLQCMERLFSTG